MMPWQEAVLITTEIARDFMREWRALPPEDRQAVLVVLDKQRHVGVGDPSTDSRRKAFTCAAFLLTLLVDTE